MKKTIELYLISGFLGSGKTTFLKQLLQQESDKRVGVIVNEFGSVGIDGKVLYKKDLKMVEINNGSIFCACLKGDFVKTLIAFLEQPIDVLFIEASGMADPSSMKSLLDQLTVILERKPEINSRYEYKGSTCLIDAGHFMGLCNMFQPITNQVQKSSLLILNKIDQVSEGSIKNLHNKLAQLNKNAYIYDTTFGKVPLDLFEEKVSSDGVLEGETTNTPWNRPTKYILKMNDTYELNKMKEFSLELSYIVLRLKGFFMTTQGEIAHADCVGDYIKIDPVKDKEIEIGNSYEIVLIGKSNTEYDGKIIEIWNKYFPDKKLQCDKD